MKRRWNLEAAKNAAAPYQTRGEFKKSQNGAYIWARVNGHLDEVCAHMQYVCHPPRYWTEERIRDEAKKYKTRGEFSVNARGAAQAARNIGLDLSDILDEVIRPSNYWTKDRCRREAAKYKSRAEFRKHSASACQKTYDMGWHDEFFPSHGRNPKGYWTFEKVARVAADYKHRRDFELAEGAAYKAAQSKGWLDDVCGHMVAQNESWTFEKCREVWAKYNTRGEVQAHDKNAYDVAHRNRWIERLSEHMEWAGRSDEDSIYIWRVKDFEKIYKIGITSGRLGDYRVRNAAHKTGFVPEIVIIQKVDNARGLESKLLSKFSNRPDFDGPFDGYTEMRVLTEDELDTALKMISDHSEKQKSLR